MKRKYKRTLSVCLLAVAVWMTACDKGGETDTGISTPDNDCRTHLSINAMKPRFASEDADTRSTTDENHATSFEDGDAIGLFAIRGGTLQTDCNNLKLVYDASAGTWENPDNKNVFYFEGSDYYAYSPYDAAMNGKTSVAEITSSWTIPADQHTAALFAKADLMVSQSCTADKTAKTLDITFTHAFSMLRIAARAHAVTTDGTFRYPLKTSEAISISISSTESISYCLAFDAETYRYIVRPTTSGIPIDIVYNRNDGDGFYLMQYTGSNTGSLGAGQFKKYTPLKTRQPEVGDYFYADGSIYPKEGSSPPNKDNGCVGVIFSMTPNQYDTNHGAHGYVMALKEKTDYVWDIWGTAYAETGFSWKTSNSEEGFGWPTYDTWTKAANANSGNRGAPGLLSNYPAFQKAAEYQDEVPLPNGYQWYLPTAYQFIQIVNNLGGGHMSASNNAILNDGYSLTNIEAYKTKVGGNKFQNDTDQFWTCQEGYSEKKAICVQLYSNGATGKSFDKYYDNYGLMPQCMLVFVF